VITRSAASQSRDLGLVSFIEAFRGEARRITR
jgi:hypothetical protein